jgi:hypothetical protein
MELIVNKYDYNKNRWEVYLTSTFKYILYNSPKYAKYISAIGDNLLFSFLVYSRLNKDCYSKLFKKLLISNIYELNRIQALGELLLGESIIVFGSNIIYIDSILLIMEIVKKYENCCIDKDLHIIMHLQILEDILPPLIYDRISSSNYIDIEIHLHFVLAFCYLNAYGETNGLVIDFCASIYNNTMHITRAIRTAIGYFPNITHLKKYNI